MRRRRADRPQHRRDVCGSPGGLAKFGQPSPREPVNDCCQDEALCPSSLRIFRRIKRMSSTLFKLPNISTLSRKSSSSAVILCADWSFLSFRILSRIFFWFDIFDLLPAPRWFGAIFVALEGHNASTMPGQANGQIVGIYYDLSKTTHQASANFCLPARTSANQTQHRCGTRSARKGATGFFVKTREGDIGGAVDRSKG